MKKLSTLFVLFLFIHSTIFAQERSEETIDKIVHEAEGNSQLEDLAHHLMDKIGPRLVGTPQMDQASDWIVDTYKSWGISAERQNFGKWKGWERGITHVDMISPWVRS